MTNVEVQPCWRVWGWNRATLQWTVRSQHPTHDEAVTASHYLIDHFLIRARITESTRRVAVHTEAHAPTTAQEFRHQQFDRMVIRRQTHAYFKSGCNGTELLHNTEKENTA